MYCKHCRSADTWGGSCFCVALELVVYDGGTIGCIVAHMVLTVRFYQCVLVGSWCH